MSQQQDVIIAHLEAELRKGSSIRLPYPRERGMKNYTRGSSVLKVPDLAKRMFEGDKTFVAEFCAR